MAERRRKALGKGMFHCHVLEHDEAGMMAMVEVT
jgi:FtsP/CotA-like multicopper oxidase with cupredoxin domain